MSCDCQSAPTFAYDRLVVVVVDTVVSIAVAGLNSFVLCPLETKYVHILNTDLANACWCSQCTALIAFVLSVAICFALVLLFTIFHAFALFLLF